VDQLTLAALEATLTGPPAPVRTALARTQAELLDRARRLATAIGEPAEAVPTEAAVGGGGAPGVLLPSAGVGLPATLAEPLRRGEPPVVGHVEEGRLLLDLIAVEPVDDDVVEAAVRRVLEQTGR
jgi:L-seryl-tRNA(Ser) seleniumtransferase